jgi:hypothetical protein
MSYFSVEVNFIAANPSADAFEAFLDRVVDELESLGVEVDVTAALASYEASFLMATPDLSDESLIGILTGLRAALHAADCGTAGWPQAHEILGARAVKNPALQEA